MFIEYVTSNGDGITEGRLWIDPDMLCLVLPLTMA